MGTRRVSARTVRTRRVSARTMGTMGTHWWVTIVIIRLWIFSSILVSITITITITSLAIILSLILVFHMLV